MPSEIMDQRHLSSFYMPSAPSSFFSEEIALPSERQVGFLKTESVPDHIGIEGISLISRSKSVSSSPLEELRPVGGHSADSVELPQPYFFKNQKTEIIKHHLTAADRTACLSMTSWRAPGQHLGSAEGNKAGQNGIHYESSLFSSSMSEIFNKKLRLSTNDDLFGQSVDTTKTNFGEEELFESLKEIEAQTIGDLLPDDDDLLSGVIDGLEYIARPNHADDIEDDLFYSGGGMELEADDDFTRKQASNGQEGELNSLFSGGNPSRTLFVRNISSNFEDSEIRLFFEQYGDIHTLYTACKNRGFVLVSYYDIRAALKAIRALQNKPMKHQKLDISFSRPKEGNHSEKQINQGTLVIFNADSSISNDDLYQIFGVYGEIKEIHETPHRRHHKLIEFYDVRAAEAALHALNRHDIMGKKIKLETSHTGGARRSCSMQELYLELEEEESNGCRQESPCNNAPSEYFGSVTFGASTSNSLDTGAIHGLHSAPRVPVSSYMETRFNGISSRVPHSISSPLRLPTMGNHTNPSGHGELRHSLGQMNFGFQNMPTFHPHSLPEFHDGVIDGISFNSPSTMSAMPMSINSRLVDGIDSRHIHRVGSGGLGGHAFEHNEAAFGVSANGSCPLHGHQFVWNNSNTYHHHSPGHMLWPNSSSFVNNIPTPQHPQMQGLPRGLSHMLNPVLPLNHHNVGSAPAINLSPWERQHINTADFLEASNFHPGSVGNLGFSSGSPLHAMELASRNIFPNAGGNCIDSSIPSSQVGIPSPQQRGHMFHGRSNMIPMPASYDAPNDRIRSRRSDPSANHADNKKQYELDIDRIIRGEDSRTTLMIKNIPNKYTSKMLLAAIDEHHRGTYDFIYLPIDFKNKCNVGYAFINMIDPQHIIPFYQAFNGKKWEKFNSEKVASLAYARIQGKAALIAHFQNSSLMNEDKRCRPILFHSDGPNAGDQEPFPMGVNIRSRRSRTTAGNEENHYQGSPSNSANDEESANATDSCSVSTKDSE